MICLPDGKPAKIAVIHDWLTISGGAEATLRQILRLYPQADLFTLFDFMPEEQKARITQRQPATSFLQKLPLARRYYRFFLPLMPLAVEQIDLSGYDLILSSSFSVAKGVIVAPDQIHVSYVYSPLRYAWDMQNEYLRGAGLKRGLRSALARMFLHYIRGWDTRTSMVDHLIAISEFIARRIWRYYRRESTVIYPPVDVDSFTLNPRKEDDYLCVSRLVEYKRVDLIVEAFTRMPEKRLVVIGEGPELKRIRSIATGNIDVAGYQPPEVVKSRLQNAKALVFAAKEDFGIVPVEAQACGTPVIAYGKGGALETVVGLGQPHPTGLFFDEQSPEALVEAVQRFERDAGAIDPADCRANAERFGADRFCSQFSMYVENAWENFVLKKGHTRKA